MSPPRHLAAQLPGTASAPAGARAFLEGAVSSYVSEEVLSVARLLVTELVTNSVVHAAMPAGSPIRVEIEIEDSRLRVEVLDPGFEPPDLRPVRRADSGFGLHLVDELADGWGSEHDGRGTCVWFELSIPEVP